MSRQTIDLYILAALLTMAPLESHFLNQINNLRAALGSYSPRGPTFALQRKHRASE